MKANELRIGNLVMYDNYNLSVIHGLTDSEYGHGVGIHYGNCCVGCSEELIQPIPLTENWLFKFKFKKDNDIEFHIHSNNNHLIYIYFEKMRNCYAMIYNGSQFTEVKYVHQLQNLYFAITGQELAIA